MVCGADWVDSANFLIVPGFEYAALTISRSRRGSFFRQSERTEMASVVESRSSIRESEIAPSRSESNRR